MEGEPGGHTASVVGKQAPFMHVLSSLSSFCLVQNLHPWNDALHRGLCLSGKQRSVKTRDSSVGQLTVLASHALPPSLQGVLVIPSEPHVCPARALPQHGSHASLSADITVSYTKSKEVARNCSTPPEVFWCVFLYRVQRNAAQLHNVKGINTCVLLAKNHVSIHELLQQNLLSPVSASVKHTFMSLP